MAIRFQFRRAKAWEWAMLDPILLDSEPGKEEDTGKWKLGDGVSTWSQLDYYLPALAIGELIEDAISRAISSAGDTSSPQLAAHINSPTPHPVYDDGPSLLLLYQNAKV